MKSYTDIEQSKVLSKILPLESSDMYWYLATKDNPKARFNEEYNEYGDFELPCWSLAALLEQLKSKIRLENKQILFLHLNKYDDTDYEIRYTNSWTGEVLITEADNPIDACVKMIIKIKERNLI